MHGARGDGAGVVGRGRGTIHQVVHEEVDVQHVIGLVHPTLVVQEALEPLLAIGALERADVIDQVLFRDAHGGHALADDARVGADRLELGLAPIAVCQLVELPPGIVPGARTCPFFLPELLGSEGPARGLHGLLELGAVGCDGEDGVAEAARHLRLGVRVVRPVADLLRLLLGVGEDQLGRLGVWHRGGSAGEGAQREDVASKVLLSHRPDALAGVLFHAGRGHALLDPLDVVRLVAEVVALAGSVRVGVPAALHEAVQRLAGVVADLGGAEDGECEFLLGDGGPAWFLKALEEEGGGNAPVDIGGVLAIELAGVVVHIGIDSSLEGCPVEALQEGLAGCGGCSS